MEKSTHHQWDWEHEWEVEFGAGLGAGIRTIVPHELESVNEEEEEQMAKQAQLEEEDEERTTRWVELGRPGTPEPMSFGMTHLSDDDKEPRQSNAPMQPPIIDELFQQLSTLSTQLESAVVLSLSQAQHAAVQNMISKLKSKVVMICQLPMVFHPRRMEIQGQMTSVCTQGMGDKRQGC
jgi:hypothetical protein